VGIELPPLRINWPTSPFDSCPPLRMHIQFTKKIQFEDFAKLGSSI